MVELCDGFVMIGRWCCEAFVPFEKCVLGYVRNVFGRPLVLF